MDFLSFFKEAGERLVVPGDDQANADAIKTYIGAQGIDTSGLTVSFDSAPSAVTVSGEVPDQATREKVLLCCGNVKGVANVDDELTVAETTDESQWYDVVSGDNLSRISKQYYGDANKYQAIFEANKPMLRSPDLIYPGLKLRIPSLA